MTKGEGKKLEQGNGYVNVLERRGESRVKSRFCTPKGG